MLVWWVAGGLAWAFLEARDPGTRFDLVPLVAAWTASCWAKVFFVSEVLDWRWVRLSALTALKAHVPGHPCTLLTRTGTGASMTTYAEAEAGRAVAATSTVVLTSLTYPELAVTAGEWQTLPSSGSSVKHEVTVYGRFTRRSCANVRLHSIRIVPAGSAWLVERRAVDARFVVATAHDSEHDAQNQVAVEMLTADLTS